METLDFLQALFETAPPGSGVVEFRGLRNDGGMNGRLFTADKDEMRGFLRRFDAGFEAGAYFGVALRKPGSTTGKKTDISVVTSLWADVDVDKMGWDMNRTIGLIKSHELRPSAIVNSGHGLHLYWVLKDALKIDNSEYWADEDDGIEVIEETMRRLADVFGGDRTHDVTRVLRVPGTWNTKGGKALPVKLVMADWNEYDLLDLREAAGKTNQLLDKNGWLSRDEMKKKLKAERDAAGIIGLSDRFSAEAGFKPRKLGWEQIWQLTKYGGANRGSAFIGLDEAILRATAYLYAHKPFWDDDKVVEEVLAEVRRVKAKQAPHETWDWTKERREIADKLARFKARWQATAERSKESGRKRN